MKKVMSGIIGVGALLVFLSMPSLSCAQCSSNSGIGDTECVLLTPYYFEYQWATCLTDAYIRRASNQNHVCRGGATICWYQCQLELNGFEQGPVYDNCSCSTANTSPTPNEGMPTLAPHCFSPGALDCSWYRECLEVRYPCQGTEDGYAIEYAEKYCNLYTDNYNDFSPSGRLWIDGVRKCLQLALVPSLRPWIQKTCADISRDAFNSHSGCYITPASGAPSICELSCLDVWKSFWIVNVVGDAFTSAPVETGKQMLDVMRGCFGTTGCIGITTATVSLGVPGFVVYQGTKSLLRAVTGISQFIAVSLNLNYNGIGWFPYFDNSTPMQRQRRNVMTPQTTDSNGVGDIMLLFVDLKLLNISNGTSTPTDNQAGRQSLEETITAFRDAVSNGVLSRIPVMLNDAEVIFGISSLGRCGDTFCSNNTNVTLLATASGTLKFSTSPANILIVASTLFIFMS